MKLRFAAPLLAVVLTILSAPAFSEETIKIVSSLPRTGSANAQTSAMVNGIRQALSEVEYKVGDFNLQYEDWDDASPERGNWDPAVEAANADKAINDADVMAYIGTYNSGAAKISMPKLNQAGLLMVSPGNTWPGLTKPGIGEPNEPQVYRPSGKVTYFRVVPTDDLQGPLSAEWANEMGVKTVFVLQDGELYGKGIAKLFQKRAQELGMKLLGHEEMNPKASNYRSLAVKVRQTNPDLVYFGGITQSNGGQLAKDLHAVGYRNKLMVPDGCFETAFIQAAGKDALEGKTFVTFGGVPPVKLTGKGAEFYKKYKELYGTEPEAYATYGYEAARAVIEGIRTANKKDRTAIIQGVAAIKDFDGLLGKWSFDENGDTTLKVMSGNVVRNGAFEFVKLLGQPG